MRRAPIAHTCPDIDKVINILQGVEADLTDVLSSVEDVLKPKLVDVLKAAISEIEPLYNGSKSNLEQLRESNSTLREWGEELYDEKEELQKENYSLQDQCNTLEARVSELEKEVEELGEELLSYD